jgi:urease gamma subunit
MALTEPLSVTIDVDTHSLPRVGFGIDASKYITSDGNVEVETSHQYGKRTRRVARLNHRKIAADPLISAQNVSRSMSTYMVVDLPQTGYTVAEAQDVVDGFIAFLTANTSAVVTALLGGEV